MELLRDSDARPARQYSLLFRYFPQLTLEDFFTQRLPGAPWFIQLKIRTRLSALGYDSVPAEQLGGVLAERRDTQPVALLSAPGTGKTTLQLYLAFCCLDRSHPLGREGYVPCFISGHEFFADFYEHVRASLGLAHFTRDQVREFIATVPRILFLIDLNRVPLAYHEAFARLITTTFTGHDVFRSNQHRVVVAARSNPRLFAQFSADGYSIWSPEPLPDEQVREFLDTIVGDSLNPRQRARLHTLQTEQRALFRNPFHLSLIAILLADDPDKLDEIESAGQLFSLVTSRVLEHEFEQWEGVLSGQTGGPAAIVFPAGFGQAHPGDLVLQAIAYQMNRDGQRTLHRRKNYLAIVEQLASQYRERPWWPRVAGVGSPRSMQGHEMAELLAAHSLFRASGDHLVWIHDTFQDFYAGKYLAFDHQTGLQRQGLFNPGGSREELRDAMALLNEHVNESRWFDQLHFLIELLEPAAFERLVDEWCLYAFIRNPRGFTVHAERRPTPYALRYLVEYLLRLRRHDDIDLLVQKPFLEAKQRVRELGVEACIPDITTKLELRRPRAMADPVRFFEPYCWLAVARAVANDEVEAGSIIRDFLGGAPATAIRARIDALTDEQVRFFHNLLAAEVHARRDEVEAASTLLDDAFQPPIPGAAFFRARPAILLADLREYWVHLYTRHELPPQHVIHFISATRPGDDFLFDFLARVLDDAGRDRALTLYSHVARVADRPRKFKPILKAIVAQYAKAGFYSKAEAVIEQAEEGQRDELYGDLIEYAFRYSRESIAADLMLHIDDERQWQHLELVLDKQRPPRALYEAPDVSSKLPAADGNAQGLFFVRSRTEILRHFKDNRAGARPPVSVMRRLSPVFDHTDRVAALSRWGALFAVSNEGEMAESCFTMARESFGEIKEPGQRVEPAFDLYRNLYIAGRHDDARRQFETLLAQTRKLNPTAGPTTTARERRALDDLKKTRARRRSNVTAEVVAEHCAYWGFIESAEVAAKMTGEPGWMTRGRFHAHYMRHRLGVHDPASAFAWYETECPRYNRAADKRWNLWFTVIDDLQAIWQAVGAGDLTGAMREIDAVRATIDAFPKRGERERDRERERTTRDQHRYFRGQLQAHVALFLAHHDALRPLAHEAIRRLDSPPMRSYCACQMIKHARALAPNLKAAEEEALDDTVHEGLRALAQFDPTYIRHKSRVVRDWAEALAMQPESRLDRWLAPFIQEVTTDGVLIRTALPDLAWLLTRRDGAQSTKFRWESLDRILRGLTDANALFGRR